MHAAVLWGGGGGFLLEVGLHGSIASGLWRNVALSPTACRSIELMVQYEMGGKIMGSGVVDHHLVKPLLFVWSCNHGCRIGSVLQCIAKGSAMRGMRLLWKGFVLTISLGYGSDGTVG